MCFTPVAERSEQFQRDLVLLQSFFLVDGHEDDLPPGLLDYVCSVVCASKYLQATFSC